MRIPDLVDLFPAHDVVRFVYGEPYHTADGATIITVARVRRRGRRSEGDGDDFTARPVGVFVVQGQQACWVPAVDTNRIALIGVITGLLAAVITSFAVFRHPPWPNLQGWPPQGR